MTPDEWFDELSDGLDAVADASVVTDGEVPGRPDSGDSRAEAMPVTDAERDLLLDLARIAAHRSERWAAPVTTYIVGRRIAAAPVPARQRVLEALIARLDTEVDPRD